MIEVPPTIFLLLFSLDLIKNVFNLHFSGENENLDRLYNLQAFPKWITIYFTVFLIEMERERERDLLEKCGGGGGGFLEIWILDQG